MGIIQTVRRWVNMMFKDQAEKDFGVKAILSDCMIQMIRSCADAYEGSPRWRSEKDEVRTINLAKSVCSEISRLTVLAIGIKTEGSLRADWLQEQIDKNYDKIRIWVEYGAAYGTVILKPNGSGIDIFTPFDFVITQCDNNEIRGVIFKDCYSEGEKCYTRLEHHWFDEDRVYRISNRAYVSRSKEDLGRPVPMQNTKWAGMMEDAAVQKANGKPIDSPMFGVLRMPEANNVDMSSPLGMPIISGVMEELRDLDVAYSRNAKEIFDSERIVMADDRLMDETGNNLKNRKHDVKLASYVRNVFGNGADEFYQEINPMLNTQMRLIGINALLSQIGYKCGFSNGYFVFNEKTGMVTATQVESDDRRTIQLIKDVRDQLQKCMDATIYALNVYADLYGLSPAGVYETEYDFGDITYSFEEDKQTWWKYVQLGKAPFWYYLVKFEGFSEEEAKELELLAQEKDEEGLFGNKGKSS